MFEGVLPLLALAYWGLVGLAMLVVIHSLVRIARSFEQIGRALTDIADVMRRNPTVGR